MSENIIPHQCSRIVVANKHAAEPRKYGKYHDILKNIMTFLLISYLWTKVVSLLLTLISVSYFYYCAASLTLSSLHHLLT